jgi:hypothetical protein
MSDCSNKDEILKVNVRGNVIDLDDGKRGKKQDKEQGRIRSSQQTLKKFAKSSQRHAREPEVQ